MPGDSFDAFVEDYFAECDEHLSAIRRLLLDVDTRSPRTVHGSELAELARRFETIKALSKIVAFAPAEEIAKSLESLVHGATLAEDAVHRDVLSLFLAGVGVLERSVQSKRGWHPAPDHRPFVAAARDFLQRRRDEYPTAVVHTATSPAEVADFEIADSSRRVAVVPAPRASRVPDDARVVSVPIERVDALMRTIGEIAVLRSRLDDSLAAQPGERLDELRSTSRSLERHLRKLRMDMTRLRRVSVVVLFERARVVTDDLLRTSDGSVQVQFGGVDTEIDVGLADALMPPVLHLVRVVTTHAMEASAVRRRRGEATHGTIALRARSTGDRCVVEAEHDVPIDNGGDGLTRGVDAVRAAVRELDGDVTVSSAPWRGTRVTIDVPVRHVVTDALIVTVGDREMAIPLLSLREVVRLDPGMIATASGVALMTYRGSAMSLVSLQRHFGVAPAARSTPHVLVIQGETHRLGLVVDGVTGIREIVVRPLSDPRGAAPGVTGATELGTGRTAVVIDAASFLRRGSDASFTTAAGTATPATP